MSDVIKADIVGGQWNHDLLARMLAPHIADFTEATIPPVAVEFEEGERWISNLFLNSVFGKSFVGKWRIYVLNIIFRSQNCLREYERASQLTANFLHRSKPSNPSIQTYFVALSAWECSFVNFSIALDVFKKMNGDIGAFAKNDESVDGKAYYFANVIKHYGGQVFNDPEFPPTSELLPAHPKEPHAIPVWLTNKGFASGKEVLGYGEYARAVTQLCELADQLSNPNKWIEDQKRRRDAQAGQG